ncbi:MAG: efflux RND transporter periplasmic adaptor subunit, partial [Candidatus Paceibacterota bacterium]
MNFFRFLKKHKKKTIFFVIVAGLIGWGAWSMRPKPPVYTYSTVTRRDLVQEVSVTGRVTPAEDVSLAFQAGGRVSKTYVKVGDTVMAGDLLADLQTADLRANLEQANAQVDAARANLNQLRNGPRSETVDVQKVVLANAEMAYRNAQKSVATTIADAYTKTDDVIRNKVDRYFLNPRSLSPQLVFSLNDFYSQTYLESNRVDLEKMLGVWKTENASLEIAYDPAIVLSAKEHLIMMRTYLDTLAGALTNANPSPSATQAQIDAYKTDISAGRTIINTALASLEAETDALSSAKSAVDLQYSNLALTQAPTLPETIEAQVAVVEQAKANVSSIEANLQKTVLYAPISGVITSVDAKAGEIVSPGVSVVSIISKDKLLIEAFIPEADIAKITLGDTASVTLDAYGDTVKFSAAALFVDPSETMIEGVATYKMKFQFNEDNEKIKPGMTANMDIRTEKHDGVLSLPQRVLIRKDTGTFVQILENEKIKEI